MEIILEDFMFEEEEKEFILYEMFGINPNDPDAASDLEEAIDCYWS